MMPQMLGALAEFEQSMIRVSAVSRQTSPTCAYSGGACYSLYQIQRGLNTLIRAHSTLRHGTLLTLDVAKLLKIQISAPGSLCRFRILKLGARNSYVLSEQRQAFIYECFQRAAGQSKAKTRLVRLGPRSRHANNCHLGPLDKLPVDEIPICATF
jgi:hypothetical protein